MLSFISFQGFYISCVDTVSRMDSGVTVVTDPVVTVRITSTICSFETEKKFMRGITIAEFKVRLIIISQNAQIGTTSLLDTIRLFFVCSI